MLHYLDVSYLEDKTDNAILEKLCMAIKRAPHTPAGICVYLRDLPFVKSLLTNQAVAFVSVINFPAGNATNQQLLAEINMAKKFGADEIDVVIPYREFLQERDFEEIGHFVEMCRLELPLVKLKVILETGEINQQDDIYGLSLIACEKGADFIKTSTGKATGATAQAVDSILHAIQTYHQKSSRKVGLKVSRGRTHP